MAADSISPLDGRYSDKTLELRKYFSEQALMRYRVYVEVSYLLFLSKERFIRKLKDSERNILTSLYERFDEKAALRVKAIEATTNHDVKAIEYYLKENIGKTSLKDVLEFIHLGLTSEDVNNLSYTLMFKDALKECYMPSLRQVIERLAGMAKDCKKTAMLSRTHGQAASPTTFGKECAVFLMRLAREYHALKKQHLYGKLNGAVGNFNAHCYAYPKVDWLKFSAAFVKSLGLDPNIYTTQIEPHDSLAAAFHNVMRLNTILTDLSRDFWLYISQEYLIQSVRKEETGSSTMPHKVNPIDFENAEGNLGLANSLFSFMAEKLPVSRLQRDLSDSTVIRNQGVALGYSLLALKNLQKGLGKTSPNVHKMREELDAHPEVLGEAIQTVLRREEKEMPYEKLKALTRGKKVSIAEIRTFIMALDVSAAVKKELLKLRPEDYIGLAEKIVEAALKEYGKLVYPV